MEGNGQFPRHVLLLPAILAACLGVPIRPGLKEEGTASPKEPPPQPQQSRWAQHWPGSLVS